MDPAAHYNEMVLARASQQQRLNNPFDESYWERYAPGYRFDPHREPEPLLAAALRYVKSNHDVIEVGGGAGRIGLPFALRARSLLNVEPSAAMREQFRLAVADFGIDNATVLPSRWPTEEDVQADLVITADVTYFISDIEAFVRALNDAARHRVIIFTWTVPPPNVNAELFEVAFGEPEEPSPGFRELLPVIWKLGIAPDVQVVDEPFTWPAMRVSSDDDAVRMALDELGLPSGHPAGERIRPHLDDLFDRSQGYRLTWRTPSNGMLITWRTD
ncbi:MAG: class I SAM-dependent methyltransferase [Chloroflexota bacterium]|nr:class I SAM-dependent methyltransferase [Chloroflexota bacterium]